MLVSCGNEKNKPVAMGTVASLSSCTDDSALAHISCLRTKYQQLNELKNINPNDKLLSDYVWIYQVGMMLTEFYYQNYYSKVDLEKSDEDIEFLYARYAGVSKDFTKRYRDAVNKVMVNTLSKVNFREAYRDNSDFADFLRNALDRNSNGGLANFIAKSESGLKGLAPSKFSNNLERE